MKAMAGNESSDEDYMSDAFLAKWYLTHDLCLCVCEQWTEIKQGSG